MTTRHLCVLVCDLDGTLVDSLPDLASALNQLLTESGRPPLTPKKILSMVGDGAAKLVERGFLGTGAALRAEDLDAALVRFLRLYDAVLTRETRVYPEVRETLEGLRSAGWRIAVCTNKPEKQSRLILDDLGLLPLFAAVAGGDSFDAKKPDPRHLTRLLQRIAAEPRQAVMLGDAANDVLTAQRAGVPSVLVSFGYGDAAPASLGADRVIDSFSELPGALRELETARRRATARVP